MISSRRLMAASLLCFAAIGQHAQAQWGSSTKQPAPQQQMQRPHPAVVRIIASEGNSTSYGSGTLVEVNQQYGLVVTNWHVVRDARNGLIVVFPDGFQSTARLLKIDKAWDLAALLIHRPTATPVPLAAVAPQRGEVLTIAGYGSGWYRAASGRVTQYVSPGEKHPFEMVEVRVAARNGDSGGPMFNARGELAGVLFGEGRGHTSGSYAGRVRQFLQPVRLEQQLPTEQIASSQPAASRAKEPVAIESTESPQRDQDSWRRQTDWQKAAPHAEMIAQNDSRSRPVFTSAHDDARPKHWPTKSAPSSSENGRQTLLPDGPVASTMADDSINLGELLGDTPLAQLKTFLAIVGAFTLVIVVIRTLSPA